MPSEPPAKTGADDTTGTTVAKGGFWNLASSAIPQIYLVATSVAAARFLGPERFGRQSFIAFVVIALATLLTAGFPNALVRYVGDAVGRKDQATVIGLLRWGWRLESVAGVLGGVALLAIAFAGATPRAAWIFGGIAVTAQVLTRVPNSFLNGLQRWREPSIITLVVGLVGTVATIGVLAVGGGISGMFAVQAIFGLVILGWMTKAARSVRPTGTRALLDRKHRRAVMRFALLGSAGVVLTLIVYRRSEFLVLNRYSSDSQIALYAVGFSFVGALLVVPQALVGVTLPAVARLWGAGQFNRVRAGYGRATRLLLLVSLPLTAGGLALGPETVRLVYGPGFSSIGPVLLILLAPMPLLSAVSLSNVVLAATGRLIFPLIVGTIAAAVNIGLDFALIPAHGATGAALANSGAQLVAGVPVLVYAQRLIRPSGMRVWSAVRAAAAATLAGFIAWGILKAMGGIAGVSLGFVVGGLAFVLLASCFRILIPEDADWLEQAAGRRLAPAVRRLARWWSPRQAL